MPNQHPIPLYPTYEELKDTNKQNYPELFDFLSSGTDWRVQNWDWGKQFLLFIGRNKSIHTYTRFRSELEKFLLWLFLYKDQQVDTLRKSDILEYMDFTWQPPLNWICLVNFEKFQYKNGVYIANPDWAPFRMVLPKGADLSSQP